MFFDWIARDGGALLSWWLLALLAAAAIFPLFFRLMRALPSRGLALMPAAGLMLVGFLFWLLNCLGFLQNTPGATVLAALIVLALGVVGYVTWPEREPVLPWLRNNLRLIVTGLVLFTILFVGWAALRALNPNLTGTEKPMEMAFLSAIRRSATFPPNDPWMSGYAISYYYFGYVIVAMLANLSGVTSGVAFNLALPLLFALTGLGVFGIAYDLVAAHVASHVKHKNDELPARPYPPALAVGILAAIFAVIMGNLGTAMVEIPFQACTASPAYLQFMDIQEREAYPIQAPSENASCGTATSLDPLKWRNYFWWWFRYSRVVTDHNLDGTEIGVQPITEFPQFSFVLSDMHPHVLALPFAALVIGLALNLALMQGGLSAWEVGLYAIFAGGMIFLNSWDAVYLGLIVGAEALRRLLNGGTGRLTSADWWSIGRFALTLLVLTGILYAPFFISFRSQAGGILPNVIWPTEFQQFFVMFGPFLVIIAVFLGVEMWRAGKSFNTDLALKVVGGVAAFALVAFVVLMVSVWVRGDAGLRNAVYQVTDQSGGLLSIIPQILARRAQGLLTEGVLILGTFLVVGRLFVREPQNEDGTPATSRQILTYSPATGFALLLIAAGAVLTLAPDFVYLRDNFGVRINTVFKLYYQGWMLWSVASAFALWSVLSTVAEFKPTPLPLRTVFGVVSTALIVMGLVYPVYAITSRYVVEAGRADSNQEAMTLEGGPSLALGDDDYKSIQCLMQVATSAKDVVAEGAYLASAYHNEYGRVSALSGIPTVIGWENHEGQWRGDTFNQAANIVFNESGQRVDGRTETVGRLYDTTDWSVAQQIIKQYGITYIYVGPTERRLYTQAGLAKFAPLTPVCSSGDVDVYSVNSIGAQAPTATGN